MIQGDACAPVLFNVVLETEIWKSEIKTQGTIFNRCSQIVAYVDNVVILGRRLQDVKNKIFTSLVQQTNKMGLEINGKKRQNLIYHESLNLKINI